MKKYSLCLETVFDGMDMCDKIVHAKDFGLDAVEFWEPEKFDSKKIGAAVAKAGIPLVACCIYDTRSATINLDYTRLEKNLLKTIDMASDFGCTNFIALGGNVQCKVDSQKAAIIENLKRAAEVCEKKNVTIVLEPLNSMYDHLGYYLDSSYVGFEIIRAVNSPRIKLLYDMYHMQLMEGNLINNALDNINNIAHIHSAGVPGRHELQNGEVNYPYIFDQVDKAGYEGYIGFEYFPTYDSDRSVADMMAYLKK